MTSQSFTTCIGRSASGSLGHVLNDQHRRLVGVVIANANNAQRLVPEVDRLTRTPVRHRATERRRLRRLAVCSLELEQKPSHSVLPSVVGWDRTASRAYDKS